jgi:hypothetical protein
MRYLVIALVAVVVLIVAWIIWRWTSVNRGARQRDERLLKLLEPLENKIEAGTEITKDEVVALAARPEARHLLFAALRDAGKAELLPDTYNSPVDQAASSLAFWMMHPNELQDPPETMELVKTLPRMLDGQQRDFHVFRYRMPAGHWAGDQWQLGFGVAPPPDAEPYAGMTAAFSTVGDTEGKAEPEAVVDWYLNMLRQKGAHE